MDTQKPTTPVVPRERNLVVKERHRHEVFRQITIPLVIACFVLFVCSVLVVLGSNGEISQWADISIIWLSVPTLIISFLGMVLLAGIIYLVIRAIVELPYLTYQILRWLQKLNAIIIQINDRLTAPFIRYESFKAGSRSGYRNIKAVITPRRDSTPRQE